MSKEPQLAETKPQVTFYTKAGCHLCDEARNVLDEIAAEIDYDLIEFDIRSDLRVFEQYRYRIPVVKIDETIVAEGRIEYTDLVQVLKHK